MTMIKLKRRVIPSPCIKSIQYLSQILMIFSNKTISPQLFHSVSFNWFSLIHLNSQSLGLLHSLVVPLCVKSLLHDLVYRLVDNL